MAICENDWLLVDIYAYGSSGAISEYKPNAYDTSIAETVTENTATTTATVGTQPSATATSTNGAPGFELSSGWTMGAVVAAVAGYLL